MQPDSLDTSAPLHEPSDGESLKALAAAIIQNAIYYSTATGASVTPHDRADARAFLLDEADPRLPWWCSTLDLDPAALRDGIRARLRRRDAEREAAA